MEARAVHAVADALCPLKIVLDRVVLTSTGVLLGCWQVAFSEFYMICFMIIHVYLNMSCNEAVSIFHVFTITLSIIHALKHEPQIFNLQTFCSCKWVIVTSLH